MLPSSIKKVHKIAMGKEHLVALVTQRDGLFGTRDVVYGLGSNVQGQLMKDPFRFKCITKLRELKPKILKKFDFHVVTDLDCGKHHTIILCKI